MNSGIYRITNTTTLRSYVGSAVNIRRRLHAHRRNLDSKKHPNKRLQNSWSKWGSDSFEFVMIELVSQKENLIVREQFWIDQLNAVGHGFNVRKIAGSNLGLKSSPETRAKLRESVRNRTKEQEERRVAGLIGHVVSEETRMKISAAHKGKKQKPMAESSKKKLSAAFKGKARPNSVGKKISSAKKSFWSSRRSNLKPGERLGRGGVVINGFSADLGVRFAPTPAEAAQFHRDRSA